MYILNDILDVDRDRLHASKRDRPIAAGKLPVATAWFWAALLLLVGIGGAFLLGPRFGLTLSAYVGLTLLYSLVFKHVVLLDVTTLSLGFVLRATAGVELIRDRALRGGEEVILSPWLLVCAFFLALFPRDREAPERARHAGRRRGAAPARRWAPTRPGSWISSSRSSPARRCSRIPSTPSRPRRWTSSAGGRSTSRSRSCSMGSSATSTSCMRRSREGTPSEHLYRDRPTLVNVILWSLAVLAILYWPAG